MSRLRGTADLPSLGTTDQLARVLDEVHPQTVPTLGIDRFTAWVAAECFAPAPVAGSDGRGTMLR